MNKENSLYGIIGLLIGLIIGYAGTNSLNGNAPAEQSNAATQSSALPPDHPPTDQQASNAPAAAGGAQGDVMAAITQARQDPSNFEAQMKAADLFKQIGRSEGELEFYERAAKIKPNDADLLARMTQALINKGDKTAAASALKRLEEVSPNNPAIARFRSQLP
ncbi:MAG: tetratricopeptide repeat protein [Acidobacteria bacterium]|nr:tetratricopeptide repeat protein [Acidobacteriota bacterium]